MNKLINKIGPGSLIAAAFIGPGTVTVCTLAGIQFGYSLLWAMLISIGATIVLQEMASRIGVISQKGLAELIRTELKHPFIRAVAVSLIIAAILIGNAAYEAGNITGGVLGMESLFGPIYFELAVLRLNFHVLILGTVAFAALYIGNYKFIERFLIVLVVLMSLAFVSTTLLTGPEWKQVFLGLFKPQLKKESILTIIALIGTTVVPYNLFLHASLAKSKWTSNKDLTAARFDTIIAVALGGLVSMSIIIAAARLPLNDISTASDLALSLEPLFGAKAKYLLSIGLFAAGITSAITAPLAAAFVTTGCLGWSTDMKSKRFRAIWMLVLGIGIVFSSLDFKPMSIIKLAQIANGLLLPLVALFLVLMMNSSKVLGNYVNTKFQNLIALGIILLTVILGVKGVLAGIDGF